MKRNILAVILIISIGFFVFGQNTTPMDVILLLDTSSSMGSSYENVSNYITGVFLSEFLRVGDTFHLIPFSAGPRLDVARRIASIGDVETIIGRMLLQYPVESGHNIGDAIAFSEQYITSLPQRPKKIVLVSTGSSDAGALVNAARQRLGSRDTSLDFIQVTPGQPLANLPVSGRPGTVSPRTVQPAVQQPAGVTPSPGTAQTPVTETEQTQVSEAIPVAEVPAYEPASTDSINETPGTTTAPPVPERLIETRDLTSSMPFVIGGIVLLLLLLLLVIFFVSRRLGKSPNRVMAEVASSKQDPKEELAPFVDHSKELAKYAAVQTRQRTTPYSDRPAKPENSQPPVINPTGPLLLNLFVEEQNSAIGKRNIHSLKSGYNLSVGGGQSDFLVFLVPMPPNIGEIRRSGSQCTFVPKKPKYFPDLGSGELRDCINKTIRVISDKNYEVRFRFEMYEDPLVALNRMLMSIKVPG
jgi:hypothetical protein